MPKDIREGHHRSHRSLPYPVVTATTVTPYPAPTKPIHRPLTPPTAGGDRRSSSTWSPEQDKRLMRARQQGMNWGPISRDLFPDKTPNACRKRHERLMVHYNNAGDWDTAKIETLAKAYYDVRQQMWQVLADHMGVEKWHVVEAKCMEKGLKTLLSTGKSAIKRGQIDSSTLGSEDDDEALSPRTQRSRSHANSEETFPDFASYARPPLQQQSPSLGGPGAQTPPLHPPYRSFSGSSSIISSSGGGLTPSLSTTVDFPSQFVSAPRFSSPNQSAQTLPSFSSTFSKFNGITARQPVTTHG